VTDDRQDPHTRVAAKLDALLEGLLAKVDASRTTVRLDIPSWGVSVNDVIAEACAPGVRSIRGDTSIDQRALATVKFLDQRRELLVQPDFENTDHAPPPALISVYGVKAQMLAPLVARDELVGWVSVHYTPSAREWTADDVAALTAAAAEANGMLDAEGVPAELRPIQT
jgi:maleate isomerase